MDKTVETDHRSHPYGRLAKSVTSQPIYTCRIKGEKTEVKSQILASVHIYAVFASNTFGLNFFETNISTYMEPTHD